MYKEILNERFNKINRAIKNQGYLCSIKDKTSIRFLAFHPYRFKSENIENIEIMY